MLILDSRDAVGTLLGEYEAGVVTRTYAKMINAWDRRAVGQRRGTAAAQTNLERS